MNRPASAPQHAFAPPSRRSAFAPEGVIVGARHVRVGAAHWCATLVVTGYPRDVAPGWLEPLTNQSGRTDVSVHIVPIDAGTATARLRRQLARLESGLRSDTDHGRLRDPYAEAATEDAYALADRVARGEGRLFSVGLSITVHAGSHRALTARVEEVRTLAAGLLIDAHPTSYRALPAWMTGLPLGLDRLAQHRTFDTDALAAAFPLASPDLSVPLAPGGAVTAAPPAGVLYGHNLASRSLVFWDRFSCDNYNSVVLGRSGAGKSYLVKLELLRSLYRGIEAHVIDPEDEYTRLAASVGGVVIRPGTPGVHLNPLDLTLSAPREDGSRAAPRDALTRRALFLHTLFAVLLDTSTATTAGPGSNAWGAHRHGGLPGQGLSALDRAVLDTAITATYTAAGITENPDTWTRPAPLLADLRRTLLTIANATAHPPALPTVRPAARPPADPAQARGHLAGPAERLAALLHPFTDGAFRGLFAGSTSTHPHSHLVVWALRDLPDALRPVGTLLALDAIWTQVTDPSARRPRLITVDEAWLLMAQPAGAAFLLRAAKAGRKHWAGLTIATQDTADVRGSDLGRAVVANAATQILLRQAPQAIDAVTIAFDLSAGERAFLLAAERGQALLAAGRHRAALHALAADTEHELITTDPTELAHRAGHASLAVHEQDPDRDYFVLPSAEVGRP